MPLAPFLRLFEARSVRKRRDDLPTLCALVSSRPDIRLLDIGGGAGSATAQFAASAREVVVLEPNDRKVRLGQSIQPTFRFVKGIA
jgi:predicted O-methyltransferase YrrM